MPWAAPRRCPVPGHPPFTGRRCPLCEREYDRERGPPSRRGYGRDWKELRASFLLSHPLCAICGGAAAQVDHIVPIAKGGARMDANNLRALCASCHATKTRLQSKAPMIY
jgi:5-methylcytosine-specific restriction protein A